MTYKKILPKNLHKWVYNISAPYKIKTKGRLEKNENEKITLCVVTVDWLQ